MKFLRRILKKGAKFFKEDLGYTLLEVAAVVTVTAALAVVAAPVVKDKVQDGKMAAAAQDMKNLSGAIVQYFGDLGNWPNANATVTYTVATVLRTSDTIDPVVTARDDSWISGITVKLSEVLSTNTANRPSWKGPYVSKPELFDPWGHPYYVTVEDEYKKGMDPNHKTAIFVLSAGKNEKIDTTRSQDMQTFAPMLDAPTTDDIIIRIR